MITLRASSLGSCIKAQAALALGYAPLPVPDRMQEVFDRGNDHEDACLDQLQRRGYDVAQRLKGFDVDEDQIHIVLQCRDGVVTGHLDGVVQDPSSERWRVLEIKSPASWEKFHKAHLTDDWSDPLADRYRWQISTYMWATEMEACIACYDGENLRTFVIEMPPIDYPDVNVRVSSVAGWVTEGELPLVCTSNDYPCPVAYLHETPDTDDDPELDRLCADYDAAGMMVKEWTAKQKKVQEKIREALGGREKVRTGEWTVTAYEQKGSTRWNAEALEAHLGDEVAAFRTVGAPSSRLKITKRGAADAEAE